MAARPLLQFYYVMTEKVKDKITPAINLKVDETIEEWFGPDCTVSEI